MTESGPIAIGVDVGGSGIKAAAIDTSRGVLVSERVRVPTPEPSTPAAVIASIFRLVKRVEHSMGAAGLPVGVDFPSVILDGKTMTAANVDRQWVQYPAVEHLERAMARPVSLINDADAAGLAEMRFGAGVGHRGVVLVLTLGTGVGSALFVDGVLVPNTELGHMEIRGRDAERRSAAAARVRRGLSWKAWTEDLDEHLMAIDRILWPDLIVLGGGVSKNADRFIPRLTCRPPVVPAVLRNEAGMVGAAMVAVERGGEAASSFALTFGPRSGSGTGEGETGPEPGQAATEGEPETVGESTTEVEPDDTLPDAGPPTVTVADAEVEADEEAEAWAAEIVADAEEVEAADAEEVDVRAQPIDAETTEVEPEPVEADAVEVEPEPVEADAVEVTAEPTDPGPPAEPVVDAEREPVEEAEVVELPTAADAVIDGEAVERPVADEGSGEEVPPG